MKDYKTQVSEYDSILKNKKDKRAKLTEYIEEMVSGYDRNAVSQELVEFYIKVAEQAIMTHIPVRKLPDFLHYNLIPDLMEIKGIAPATVLQSVSGELSLDAASISLLDPEQFDSEDVEYDPSQPNYGELKPGLEHKGIMHYPQECFYIVHLNVVDSFEYVLSPEERLRLLEEPSGPKLVEIKSGVFSVGDGWGVGEAFDRIELKVDPGFYEVMSYELEPPEESEEPDTLNILIRKTEAPQPL